MNSRSQRDSNDYGNPRKEPYLDGAVCLDWHVDLLCVADRFRHAGVRRHSCRDILERTVSGDLVTVQRLGICGIRDAAGLLGLAPVPFGSGVPDGSATCCLM